MVFFYIIIGMLFGSFFLVVGMRLPKGESIITPRSHCEECGHVLKWYELIPVISFIFLRGKCHKCGKKISYLYPIIEIASGLLFGIAYLVYGMSYELIAMMIISALLLIIFVSDLKYYIILDEPLIVASLLILGFKWYYFGFKSMVLALLSGIIIFTFMFIIKLVGDKVMKRESLGGGDIKLSFFIGVTLGIQLSFVALVIGSLLAFPYAFYIIFKNKAREIPYGPFLIAGTMIVFYLQDYISLFLKPL